VNDGYKFKVAGSKLEGAKLLTTCNFELVTLEEE
jgi:hypothetical protein